MGRRKMEDRDTMDKKISCAVFDVDGTLLDSMGVWANIGRKAMSLTRSWQSR